MANLGSLVVSLEANIARFEADLSKAEAVAKGAFDRIAKAGDIAASATKAIGLAIIGISAGVGLNTLVSKFQSVTQSLDDLKDMSEKTGASVENLSAIAGVAKIVDQSMDLVESGITRLSKSLAGADEEAKGAGKALADLGLSAEKLRRMDSAAAYKEIADRLAEYRDGMGKTALVQDIFGKSGAQQLPILKALAENGALVAKTTGEQADQASEYIETLNRLTAAKDALYKVIAVQVLPIVSDFIKVLLDVKNETGGVQQAVKNLAADGSIKSWAETGAMAVAHVLDQFQLIKAVAIEVATPIERIGRNIYTVGALAGIAVSGSLDEKKQAFATLQAENEKYFAGLDARLAKNREPVSLYSDRLRTMLGTSAQEAKDRAAKEAKKPTLDGYTSRAPTEKAIKVVGEKSSPFDAYVKSLDTMLQKLNESEFAAMQLRLEQLAGAESVNRNSPRYTEGAEKIERYHKALDQQQIEQYAESVRRMSQEYQFQTAIMGETVDEQNRLVIAHQNAQQVEDLIFRAQQAHRPLSLAAQNELRAASSETTAAMLRDYETRRAADEDWRNGAVRAYDDYMEKARNASKTTEDLFTNAYQSIEGAMADFLFNPFDKGVKGMLQGFGVIVQKMIAQAVAADLANRLIGTVGTPKSGGLLSLLLNGFGGSPTMAGAGSATENWIDSGGLANGAVSLLSKVAGLFGFASGTDYVPRDMLAVVHQGEKIIPAGKNNGASEQQVNHITINLSGAGGSAADMRRSSGQIAREVAAAIKGTARYA